VTIASTFSDENAQYVLSNLPAGNYLVMAEAWVDDTRYFGIATLTEIELTEGEVEMASIVMTR
jgi:hypothetical protein